MCPRRLQKQLFIWHKERTLHFVTSLLLAGKPPFVSLSPLPYFCRRGKPEVKLQRVPGEYFLDSGDI